MDYETTFEEQAPNDRFIALVISDDEEEEIAHDWRSGSKLVEPLVHKQGRRKNTEQFQDQENSRAQRDSVYSSKSSSSSLSRKRWSVIPSLLLSEDKKDSVEDKKTDLPFKRHSSASSSISSSKTGMLKGSSNRSSLRQLFNKIAINDENRENHPLAAAAAAVPTRMNNTSAGKFRAPLRPVQAVENKRTDAGFSPSKWQFWKRKSSIVPRSGSTSFSSNTEEKFFSTDPKNTLKDNMSSSKPKKKASSSSLSIHGLKHKTSHASLQKFKLRRSNNSQEIQHNNNVQISLPVPDQVSLDKLKNKLKNSNSLMSLKSYSSYTTVMATKEYDEIILQEILELCDIHYILEAEVARDSEYFLENDKYAKQLSKNVFRIPQSRTHDTVVYKKLSLFSNDIGHSKQMCLHELKMLKLCKGTTGLPFLLHAHVVQETDKELFLVLVLRDNGKKLSTLKLNDASQALSIFWQCVTILYVAESKFEFEHRNLILDHILIDDGGNITLTDLWAARARNGSDILYTRLDHPLFFQGAGDYQSKVYNAIRNGLPQADKWPTFCPRTNLLWLHYICIKFLEQLKRVTVDMDYNKLAELEQILEQNVVSGKRTFKKPSMIRSCGDLLKLK